VLDWEPQRAAYVGVFDRLTRGTVADRSDERRWPHVDRRKRDSGELRDRFGNPLVDLRNPDAVQRYVRTRKVEDDKR
jgi:hypothetical protein